MASRRKAEELVRSGRVSVNGFKVFDFVDVSEDDEITVDGKKTDIKKKVYYMLNKPKNYITTKSDPMGRKTVFDLLKVGNDVFPVGRLDSDTEGLLIVTNDGDMANKLLHPKYEVPRIYIAVVALQMNFEEAEELERGVNLPYGYKAKMGVKILSFDLQNTKIEISIKEGRKREIRRALKFLNHPVISLKRISFGPLKIDENLQPGEFRPLRDEEVNELIEYVNIENETLYGSHHKNC